MGIHTISQMRLCGPWPGVATRVTGVLCSLEQAESQGMLCKRGEAAPKEVGATAERGRGFFRGALCRRQARIVALHGGFMRFGEANQHAIEDDGQAPPFDMLSSRQGVEREKAR